MAVYDGSDNLLMRFQYADGRTPVAMTKNGQKYYLISNQVGSLRAVADTSGNLIKRIDYDSFGNVIRDTNPSFKIPFRFAGGLYDKHTDLIRFGHRDYDPATGRWTAKDPILFQGGNTYLYGYCLNDPVNLVDSNGEFPIHGTIATIGAISAITSLSRFVADASKAQNTAEKISATKEKIHSEIDKGIPDPEKFEKLKEKLRKLEDKFNDDLKDPCLSGADLAY